MFSEVNDNDMNNLGSNYSIKKIITIDLSFRIFSTKKINFFLKLHIVEGKLLNEILMNF